MKDYEITNLVNGGQENSIEEAIHGDDSYGVLNNIAEEEIKQTQIEVESFFD